MVMLLNFVSTCYESEIGERPVSFQPRWKIISSSTKEFTIRTSPWYNDASEVTNFSCCSCQIYKSVILGLQLLEECDHLSLMLRMPSAQVPIFGMYITARILIFFLLLGKGATEGFFRKNLCLGRGTSFS